MAVQSPVQIDEQRVSALTRDELARLNERTPKSAAMFQRARRTLSNGVASRSRASAAIVSAVATVVLPRRTR